MKIFKTKARLIKEQDERLTATNWFNKFESSTADIIPSANQDSRTITLKSDGLSARFVNFGGDHSDDWTISELMNTSIQVAKSDKLPFRKLLGFGSESGVVLDQCTIPTIDDSLITHVEQLEIDRCAVQTIDMPKTQCEYTTISECKELTRIGHISSGTDLTLRDLPVLKEITSVSSLEIRIVKCKSLTHIHNIDRVTFINIYSSPNIVLDHKFISSLSQVKHFRIDDSGIKRGMEVLMMLHTQPKFASPLSSTGFEEINEFVTELYSKYDSPRQRMAAFLISAPEELKEKYPAVFKR